MSGVPIASGWYPAIASGLIILMIALDIVSASACA